MLRSLLPLLACPICVDAPLEFAGEKNADTDSVTTGELRCGSCAANYPIESGIPRLLPGELLDAQKDEIAARDAQVDQYDANTFLNWFGRWEMPMTLSRLALTSSDRLLEAGCGTGRMTRTLAAKAREVVAVDFSFASLLANKRKLEVAGVRNVHLAQADLCNLPLRSDRFNRVLSCQVLEHVPGEDARRKAVASLARVAEPDARVVISAYQYSALMGKKEGRHDGGIPFFRFTRAEFRDLLSSRLKVSSITGSLLYLYLAQCDKRDAPMQLRQNHQKP